MQLNKYAVSKKKKTKLIKPTAEITNHRSPVHQNSKIVLFINLNSLSNLDLFQLINCDKEWTDVKEIR